MGKIENNKVDFSNSSFFVKPPPAKIQKTLDAIFDIADKNKDGIISLEEFNDIAASDGVKYLMSTNDVKAVKGEKPDINAQHEGDLCYDDVKMQLTGEKTNYKWDSVYDSSGEVAAFTGTNVDGGIFLDKALKYCVKNPDNLDYVAEKLGINFDK